MGIIVAIADFAFPFVNFIFDLFKRKISPTPSVLL